MDYMASVTQVIGRGGTFAAYQDEPTQRHGFRRLPPEVRRELERVEIPSREYLSWASHQKLSLLLEGPKVESLINDYISREIVQDSALLPLSNDTSLLEGGILDSLSLLRLVIFLEEKFTITVGEADLLPENFDTVRAICAYLRARQQGRLGAARG